MSRGPLHGTVVAAVTPMTDAGEALDLTAIDPLLRFYARAGAAGVLVAGTTGEGLLLAVDERTALVESVVAQAGDHAVAVHAGALTTRDAIRLASHARDIGASAVAACAPPYFAYDAQELLAHFTAVAAACEPLPFYVYEIRARVGYSIPSAVVGELGRRAENLVGMKVSNPELDEVRAYLHPRIDVLVGAEALITDAMAEGAVGAVSGLAAALPRAVAEVVAGRGSAAELGTLRRTLSGYPFQSALKVALAEQGVPISPDVRRPFRPLDEQERDELAGWLLRQGGESAGRRRSSTPRRAGRPTS
jgi:dihydrodipicolinate synthase/N-acetylneuraminate lyase